MNLLDLILLVLFLGVAVSGVVRGLVSQLFSLGGLVLAHLAGIRFYAPAKKFLRLDFPYAEAVAYVAVFLVVYVLARLLASLVEGWVRKSKLSAADRFGGFLAGSAKGFLLATLLVFLLVIFLPRDTRLMRESKAAPHLIAAGRWIVKVFPERIGAEYREKLRAAASPHPGEAETPAPVPPPPVRKPPKR